MNLSQLAIQRALENNWQEAVDLNQQILADKPNNIDALNRLAQAYIQIGNCQNAKTCLELIFEIDPQNPIAKRNLQKINHFKKNNVLNCQCNSIRNFSFIEEPGKSKTISLIQVGENNILISLQSCSELDMQVKSKTISYYYQKHYVGRLPDDVARRLIWLIERNNRYKSYLKSIEKNHVRIFIKEIKCSPKNKNYNSFL